MSLEESNFVYITTIKNEQGVELEALELFPGLSEISFQSRPFRTYAECITSCRGFMDDIARDANKTKDRFKVGSEVNPAHSGMKTISRDWAPAELARFWVYDKKMEGGAIAAICRTIISAIPAIEPPAIVN